MEPQILDEKTYKLIGSVYYGNPFHSAKEWSTNNEIGNTWKRFGALYQKYGSFLDKIRAGNEIGYEIHIEPMDYSKQHKFHVFIGFEVKNFEFLPLEMFIKILPKTKYLFFTSKYQGKGSECDYVFSQWLPDSEYEQSYPYIMQSYSPERFDPLDDQNPDNLMDWYIPIIEKTEGD